MQEEQFRRIFREMLEEEVPQNPNAWHLVRARLEAEEEARSRRLDLSGLWSRLAPAAGLVAVLALCVVAATWLPAYLGDPGGMQTAGDTGGGEGDTASAPGGLETPLLGAVDDGATGGSAPTAGAVEAGATAGAVAGATTTPAEEVASTPTADQVGEDEPPIDTSSLRRVVGYADAVFVGRVVTEVRPSAFGVEVLETIKSVRREDPDQEASLPAKPTALPRRTTVVVTDGSPTLQPGRTYMFATRYEATEKRYHAIQRRGISLITSEASRAALVKRFQRAYKHQIPYDPR